MNQHMASFYQAMQFWIIFGLLVIIFGAVFSYFAVKRIARPAKLATEYLYRIAHGDFSQRSPFEGKDEFSIIFRGIDYLAQSIAQREERLKLVGDGLQSILEKTADFPWPASFNRTCRALRHHFTGHSKTLSPYSLWLSIGFRIGGFRCSIARDKNLSHPSYTVAWYSWCIGRNDIYVSGFEGESAA